MARLQEQAAQADTTHRPPADRLKKCATHLRITAQSIDQAAQRSGDLSGSALTQKIKLLNFLRQQKQSES